VERDELAAWLRLTLSDGVGNATARRLLAAFGLPQAIFGQPVAALGLFASQAQVTALHTEPEGLAALVDTTLQWLAAADAPGQRRVVTLGSPEYPASLLAIEDPPLVLYLLGEMLAPQALTRCVAIVGSRNPTPQGEGNAQAFAKALAGAGLTVVSGLALGVDGAAHRGALEGAAPGQLATIAVVGTGLDRVYPKRHLELAHAIARRGTILSEYPLGTPPLSPNFPKRNRLISGLSRGTLVVEAALGSGSLITARQTLEQGKDVLAIPGSIHSTQSRGCHALIKQGARLVESAEEVLDELGFGATNSIAAQAIPERPADLFDPQEGADGGLLRAMGFDPVSLDALVARTGTATATLQARLLELELAGHVARLPGGLFQRAGQA